MNLDKFPHYQQLDAMDCGPTCLRMIAKHYGRVYSGQYLREHAFITREGVSIMINYSIVMRGNPCDPEASKKAYVTAQYSTIRDIETSIHKRIVLALMR